DQRGEVSDMCTEQVTGLSRVIGDPRRVSRLREGAEEGGGGRNERERESQESRRDQPTHISCFVPRVPTSQASEQSPRGAGKSKRRNWRGCSSHKSVVPVG